MTPLHLSRNMMKSPFQKRTLKKVNTIASACSRVFRQEFLKEETIGLIPSQGYQPARKYSLMALEWLAWVHHQTGDRILHVLNGGKQKVDGNYMDGCNPSKRIIYEFHRCVWHGCSKCYLPDTLNPVNETS